MHTLHQSRTVLFFVLSLGMLVGCQDAAPTTPPKKTPTTEKAQPQQTPKKQEGLVSCKSNASPGYTLLAPFECQESYLLDLQGNVVKKWKTDSRPGFSAYLLEDGSLLRTTLSKDKSPPALQNIRGTSGGIEIFDWDGNLQWRYQAPKELGSQHHDIQPLPNGNVLIMTWEHITAEQAAQSGRDPEITNRDGLFSEAIYEIQPLNESEGKIVWEWHAWDHLVQSSDTNKPHFGQPAEFPEKINVNSGSANMDWLHMNSIDYNAELDQILLSCRNFDEIWIIDHGTTTAQAAESTGGARGRGGDLLFRWGNRAAWQLDTTQERFYFHQHAATWVPQGCPGEGNILVFSNNHVDGQNYYSSIIECQPSINDQGLYEIADNDATQLYWRYDSRDSLVSFYSSKVSGAQRLPNGNTLICCGPKGLVLEVDTQLKYAWIYANNLGGPAVPLGGDRDPNRQALRTDLPLTGSSLFNAHRYPIDYSGLSKLNRTVDHLE